MFKVCLLFEDKEVLQEKVQGNNCNLVGIYVLYAISPMVSLNCRTLLGVPVQPIRAATPCLHSFLLRPETLSSSFLRSAFCSSVSTDALVEAEETSLSELDWTVGTELCVIPEAAV